MTPTQQAQSIAHEVASAGVRAMPAAGMTIWNNLATTPAEKWLTYLTIAYVVLQAALLIRDKVIRDKKPAAKRVKK